MCLKTSEMVTLSFQLMAENILNQVSAKLGTKNEQQVSIEYSLETQVTEGKIEVW